MALGEPIVPREPQVQDSPPSTPSTRRTHSRNQSVVSSASFTGMIAGDESAKEGGDGSEDGGDETDDQFADETIGKSAASKIIGVTAGLGFGASNGTSSSSAGRSGSTSASGVGNGNGEQLSANEKTKSSPPRSRRRIRPQSAYDFTSFLNQHQQQQLQQRSSQQSLQSQSTQSSQGSSSVAPLRLRWRSQSTDRGDGSGATGKSGGGGESGGGRASRFIDPLVMRKQEKEMTTKLPMPKPIGKVPVGQLVAFFDGEKKDKS